MYDFASSGYSTVVLTAIYSAYFVGVVAQNGNVSSGAATAWWTSAIAAANLLVLLSGPVIGAIADHRASKKPFLVVVTLLCIGTTALLSLPGPGQLMAATSLVVVSYVLFATGENLISAFLPEIADAEQMGRVSGYGWGIGYLGGLTTLALCLAYISWSQQQGQAAEHYVPVTLLITAAVMLLACLVTFFGLRERAVASPVAPGHSYVWEGFRRLRRTLSEAHRFEDLFRFLFSLVAFQAGVSTVFVVAAIYAQEEMGFATDELVTLIMVVNVTAAAGALAVGHLQDRFGSRFALSLSLAIWILALATIYVSETRAGVWLGANLIGIAMGACQASGRALIGHFTPLARTGEFYGLWGLAVNLAAIIGPLSYGLVSYLSGGNHRAALLTTLGFFIVGWLLLLTVDEGRGKRAAAANHVHS